VSDTAGDLQVPRRASALGARAIVLPEQDATRAHRVVFPTRYAPTLNSGLLETRDPAVRCYYELAASFIAEPLQNDTHHDREVTYHRLVCCGLQSFKRYAGPARSSAETRPTEWCYEMSVEDASAFVFWLANEGCDAGYATFKKYVSWCSAHWESAFLLRNLASGETPDRERAHAVNPFASTSVKCAVNHMAFRFESRDLTGSNTNKRAFRPTVMRVVVNLGKQLVKQIPQERTTDHAERLLRLFRGFVFFIVAFAFGPRPIELYHTVVVDDMRRGLSHEDEEYGKGEGRKLSVLCLASDKVQFAHSNLKFGMSASLRASSSSARELRIYPDGAFADDLLLLLKALGQFRQQIASATGKECANLFFLLPGEQRVQPTCAARAVRGWCASMLNFLERRDAKLFEPNERDQLTPYSSRYGLASTFSVVHEDHSGMWQRLKRWAVWSQETKVTEKHFIRSFAWQNLPQEKKAGLYFFGNFLGQ